MRDRLSRLWPQDNVPVVEPAPEVGEKAASDKEANVVNTEGVKESFADDSDVISVDAQRGVQDIEALTKVWTRQDIILAYVTIWIIYFVDAMQQNMTNSLLPYVTSAFQSHSLTPTVSIFAYLISGLSKLPLAKILDIWGRPQGFLLMIICLTIGLVLMAACRNVETYAAAQVFYWVGYNGVTYSISIFIADTSSLKNRSLMFAFASSPYIITVWVGGPLADAFLTGPGWRWAFGAFSVITPFLCAPLLALFYKNYKKAKRLGVMPERSSGRTWLQSLKHYFIEFDFFGMLLLIAGLALFLLPFNIYFYQTDGWASATCIAMLVVGFVLCIAFVVYEKLWAPKTFIPFELLTDRTVLGACILAGNLFISFYIWNSFFGSFLQVVSGLDITKASYIQNIYSIGSCFWSLVVGVLIRWTGRFKWLALYFGVPLTILGVALMVVFRQPDANIGYIAMCQIFIAVAGGTLVICEQMAAMAATTHQYIAVVLAIEAMFANVGGAIGSTVATSIWGTVFPRSLNKFLPESEKGNVTAIFGSLKTQLDYEWDSETRIAIQHSYGDAMRYMIIASAVIQVVSVVSVAVWRDIKVKDFKQVKGNVI
ncbi:major facilitator superfamily domain-containing protein [Apiosordaria backusii]|uniref:Major facilitator superfamily domain-containing protein n=1 Tax=Apiosordaria backusii TaxID=314023 RepID=A0AA40DYM7_9PEZI|nr:major facilitator superfamily domain-containing protein [Apiosordaria backusii]